MPFLELRRPANSPLEDEIAITTLGRIHIAGNLMKRFPSGTLTAFIDTPNSKLGLRDSGPINIRHSYVSSNLIVAQISELKKLRIALGRYPAKWSKKHNMLIVEIEFNE